MELLLGRIAAGTYPAGAMLPKEQQLAAELDVSRGVVRECIRALEERGVVRVRHGRGATVLPARAWDVLDRDVFAAVHGAPGGRRLVGEAAALAAGRGRPDALRTLSASVDTIETAPEDLVGAAALAFERALAEASGNRLLARVAAALADAAGGVAALGGGQRGVADAVAAGDAGAARDAVVASSRR